MFPSARRRGVIRRWVASRLGLRLLAKPAPSRHNALAYIAGHHGLAAKGLIEAIPDSGGLEALCLQALGLGLRSRVVRLEAGSLNRLQLPCLVQHEQLGWMPLVAVHEAHVTVQHPLQGRVSLPRDAWAMAFMGLALEFRPAP
ncbi:hypothetical protein H5407_00825 [Mitsuaria sp. WAJ17]|uniref:cysteine peptidase family C39 domain-containing protein n=1 Tax=Mitsuaria sp. WAJ17 TaxID=2761452 RepID=UPI001600D5D2|nr:cysteine peptidase family C39 domain-containing protein [Mitsuaria sp. WAJ17]MBB2483761.1 hypothetical protein [Mitsuaria sp. WAJ17]